MLLHTGGVVWFLCDALTRCFAKKRSMNERVGSVARCSLPWKELWVSSAQRENFPSRLTMEDKYMQLWQTGQRSPCALSPWHLGWLISQFLDRCGWQLDRFLHWCVLQFLKSLIDICVLLSCNCRKIILLSPAISRLIDLVRLRVIYF